MFVDVGTALTRMLDIGRVLALDVSRDRGFCGHVYGIMALDEDNNIEEPIDLAHAHTAVTQTTILCEDGEISLDKSISNTFSYMNNKL